MNSRTCLWIAGLAVATAVWADERRAPPPSFSESDLEGVFFQNLADAVDTDRPSLQSIRGASSVAPVTAATGSPADGKAGEVADAWSKTVSPPSIEDEVKRLKLHFDSVVTTPGAFNGGGYIKARVDLTALAMLFAVITEHGGDVRWKKDAPAARDLLARTAFNCKAGSTQVYNEAKVRKADLQDLVSGAGLSTREGEPDHDWSMIVDRSPLMQYGESLIESLEDASRNDASVKSSTDQIRREAEMLSVFGEVLIKEGMDEADEEDYVTMTRSMVEAARETLKALDRGNPADVSKNVALIRQRCDTCHNEYR